MMTRARVTTLCICLALLTSCSGTEPVAEEPAPAPPAPQNLPAVSGAKAGAYAIAFLNNIGGVGWQVRPSGPLGIYASMYLAQGAFLPVNSAMLGIESQLKVLAGQGEVETSETFALLKEFGAILEVDVIDVLNRSQRRDKALDTYLRSLANITILAQRKANELDSLMDQIDDETKIKKRELREVKRIVDRGFRDDDYELAGSKQEELTRLKAEVDQLETKEKQTKEVLNRYEDLIEVSEIRLHAISKNRRILIAGLKVVEVPGIEDLHILDDSRRQRRRRGDPSPLDVELDPLGLFSEEKDDTGEL